jgi:ATP-dependent protease ClpP protease subunit
MSRSWYKIENKVADKSATMWMYDEIGGYGIRAQDFINELNGIEASEINVHINSPGGEVFEGLAIYQALKNHPANINVTVDSLAASIASVIAMAGDSVKMAKNAEFMIHDGHAQMSGNSTELTKMVALLDRASDNIASVYADRAGGDVTQWRAAMQTETWFNAEEAVAAGLADAVLSTKSKQPHNIADLRIFNFAGRQFAPAPVVNAKPKAEPYGDVEYADPGYQEDKQKRYPIDTEEHVRAAWSYINQEKNEQLYTYADLDKIKTKIKEAAKKFGIEISNRIDTQSLLNALKEGLRNG